MKTKIPILLALILAFAMGGAALASDNAQQENEAVKQATHYHLEASSGAVTALASGGHYLIVQISAPVAGEGCCCRTNLPCARR